MIIKLREILENTQLKDDSPEIQQYKLQQAKLAQQKRAQNINTTANFAIGGGALGLLTYKIFDAKNHQYINPKLHPEILSPIEKVNFFPNIDKDI